MTEHLPKRPNDRQGFKIGIICALSLEAEMVEMVFDYRWKNDGIKYGKAPNDSNTYTTGVIAGHNVVLAYCPGMGSNSAAQVAGICGAIPFYGHQETEEIVLGDCIISTAVIQFDLGRKGPDGFVTKDGLDGIGRASTQVRGLMSRLQTSTNKQELTANLLVHLQAVHDADPKKRKYLGADRDQLYQSSYTHTHQIPNEICKDCNVKLGICEKTCKDLGCIPEQLRPRKRLDCDVVTPSIHFGYFGSSNTVLKSARDRDELAKTKIIAFEMEGAGVWDVCQTVVIKAVCDYADSHKNKEWQGYAAAVSAAGLKAFLQELEFPDEVISPGATSMSLPFVDSSISKAIRGADEAIRSYYNSSNRLQIERLSGEKLPLEKCYINLGLVNRSEQNQDKEDNLPFSLEGRLRLGTNEINDSLSLKSLFETRKLSSGTFIKPRRIFIQGRAGIGKTTLCKKIVHEFQNNKLWDELFDRLLWLPLRSLKTKKGKYGWQDLLQNVYSPRVEDWDELANIMGRQLLRKEFLNKTLLLFDGLDEINHRWTREDEMFKFIESTICDAPNIIITSRPQANSFDIGKFDLELETIGFTPDQINAYLENCVRDGSAISKIQALIARKPLVQGLLRIPIQLDAFCCIWPGNTLSSVAETDKIQTGVSTVFNEDDVSTMTALYQSITNELYRKDLDRLEKAAQPRRLAQIKVSAHLQEELFFLGEYAFQGMMNSTISFTPHHRNLIDSFLFRTRNQASDFDSFVLERLSFLRTSDIGQDPSKRNYHFIHLTFQEFFAAKHFVQHWRCNADLVCLNLNLHSPSVEDETISPTKFLQTQKYNPQFNIFWRFVTGLVQEKSTLKCELLHKHKNILSLFDELNNEPIDLLGAAHRRLLMYCLSEVLPSRELQIRELRTREERLLRQWVIMEFKLANRVILGREAEYPENILCAFLRTANDLPYQATLSALKDRPFVSTQALSFVSECINDQLLVKIQLQAIKVVFKNSRNDSQKIVAQAAHFFSTILKDRDRDVRYSAVESLQFESLLPHQAITTLITAIKEDEDSAVRRSAVDALRKQSSLPAEAITILITALKDEDSRVRRLAAGALKGQSSTEAITILVTALKDEDSGVRQSAADALKGHSSLPAEAITILVTALKDEDSGVRRSAAPALKGQSSAEAINALITALKDEDSGVRWSAADALGGHSSLPAEAINALITALKDKNSRVRWSAADALGGHSSLPAEAIAALITIFEDHQNTQALDILHNRTLFYFAIKNLSNKAWQQLWSYWIKKSLSSDIYCYEVGDCLYISSNGMLHQISTDTLQTQALLQVVLPAKIQPLQATAAPDSSWASQSSDVVQTSNTNTTVGSTSKSRWRSKFGFKKGK